MIKKTLFHNVVILKFQKVQVEVHCFIIKQNKDLRKIKIRVTETLERKIKVDYYKA